MAWTWSAGPWSTGPEVSLAGATGKRVTARRGRGGTATDLEFQLTGRDRAVGIIEELVSDVWVLHDGTVDVRGRIAPASESGNLLAQQAKYSALDYREVLARRIMAETARNTWTTKDPGDAAWEVITDEQARPGSNLGIVRGIHETQATIASFNVERGKTVREALDVLAGLGAGADWDITPTSLSGLQLDWWTPGRDRDNGVVIRLGHAAVSYSRDVDTSQYGNAGRLTGQAPDAGTEPAPVRIDSADIATRPEGRWDFAESTSLTTAAALSSRGARALAERQLVPVTYTCELARGWWQGRDHLWVGDVIEWILQLSYVEDGVEFVTRDVDVQLPVDELTLDFDQPPSSAELALHEQYGLNAPAGEPKVTLTFGAPRIDDVRTIARRLSNLELR